jgi:hypothetical protein
MSDHAIESFVNCGVPGFKTIEWSTTGASWTEAIVSPSYLRFSDYLAACTDAIVGYTFFYSSTEDRVVIQPGPGEVVLHFRFSASTADLLGFATTTGEIASRTSGTAAPAGIVPVHGVSVLDSTPANQAKLRQYAHGRARSIMFGAGTFHRVVSLVDYSDLDRLLSGPCSVGRIRIGPSASSSAYSSTEIGGYIEATVARVGTPDGLDDVEGLASLELGLHANAYTAPDPFDSFWGSLERGYSLSYYARIEGIPFVFTEVDPGWTDSNRTTSATLVMGSSTSIRYRIDREQGVAQSSPIQIGILDADNALGIWGKPTRITEITEDVATATQTTIKAQSVDGWGSSGIFFLGKEYMRYGSVDAGTNTFTVVRGEINDRTTFAAGGSSAYTTLSQDRPHLWSGRICELHCFLMDPMGRAVGADWDDVAGCRQVWTGDVAGAPGYDSGVWSLHCNPLVKRLSTKVGKKATAEVVAGFETLGMNEVIAGESALSPYIVIDSAKESIIITATWTQDNSKKYHVWHPGGELNKYGTSGTKHVVRFYELLKYSMIETYNKQGLNPDPDASETSVLRDAGYDPRVAEYITDPGESWKRFFRVYNAATMISTGAPLDCSPYLYVTYAGYNGSPRWWRQSITFDENSLWNPTTGSPDGDYENISISTAGNPRHNSTGATGKNIDSVVLTKGSDAQNLMGSWPSSGFALLADEELIEYEGKIESDQYGLVALYGVTRGVDGTTCVDAWEAGIKAESVSRLEGTYGAQMLKMIESSGTGTRGTYDSEPIEAGYGIDDSQIQEPSFLSAFSWDTTTLLGELSSFRSIYGTMLGGLRQAVSPIRSGERLKLGLVRTAPVGKPSIKITDEDLSMKPPTVARVGLGPNIVRIETAKSPHIGKSSSYTFRLLADIAARGGIDATIRIPGMDVGFFQAVAQTIGSSYMLSTMGLVAYKFSVGPHKDWLPGQVVELEITKHAGIWDWRNDTTGLSGVGVILESARRLTGETEITVLVGGHGLPSALCPSVRVVSTASSGTQLTLAESTFPDGSDLFTGGEPVLIYQAGVGANYTECNTIAVVGTTMVLASSPSWLPDGSIASSAGIFVTYPSDDAADIGDSQKAHTHFDDETTWS